MPGVEAEVEVQQARAVYRRPREDRAEVEVTQDDEGFVECLEGRDAAPALDARCAEEVKAHLELLRLLHVGLLQRVCDAGTDVRPTLLPFRRLDRTAKVARDRLVVPRVRLRVSAELAVSPDASDAMAVHALFYALREERQRALEVWYRAAKEQVDMLRRVN